MIRNPIEGRSIFGFAKRDHKKVDYDRELDGNDFEKRISQGSVVNSGRGRGRPKFSLVNGHDSVKFCVVKE